MSERYISALLACACALCGFAASAANDSGFEMEEVIVTGVRDDTLWQLPDSVAVITADDLKLAPTSSIVEILSQEANVNLLSFFGNDKFAGVDVRGMGETSVSNVVVMIDGVRLNAADLSGPDFASLSVDQIERIEIIRGGGSVRYGNGAVGGVINIITRPTQGEPYARAKFGYGSFDTVRAEVQGGTGSFAGLELAGGASVSDSNGYRDNGFLHTKDGYLELRWRAFDWLDWSTRASVHADRNGFPGPVSRNDFRFSEQTRRATSAPEDFARALDRRYRSRLQLDLGRAGALELIARYRNRKNPFVLGFTPLLRIRDQDQQIDEQSRSYDAIYSLPFAFWNRAHEITVGYGKYSADYSRRSGGRGVLDVSGVNFGRLDSRALFIDTRVELLPSLIATVGYRTDKFRIRRRSERLVERCDTGIIEETIFIATPFGPIPVVVPIPIETNCRGEVDRVAGQNEDWTSDAWEAGLVFTPFEFLNVFASYSRSFRNPNVDELTLASDDLGPQSGEHWDFGLRTRVADTLEAAFSFFQFDIEDEIFFGFDVESGERVNTNFDDVTRRRGAEIEIKWRPHETLLLWTNIGYVDATFRDSGAKVPLVPTVTAALGTRWTPHPRFTTAVSIKHAGKRFDGDDLANTAFAEIPSYEVFDAKLIYTPGPFELSFSVNNLFDQRYATQGFSGTVFPMPSRNVMATVAYEY